MFSSQVEENDILKKIKEDKNKLKKEKITNTTNNDFNSYSTISFNDNRRYKQKSSSQKSSSDIRFFSPKNSTIMSLKMQFSVSKTISDSLAFMTINWNLPINKEFSNDVKTILSHMLFDWQYIDKKLISKKKNGFNVEYNNLNRPEKPLPYTLELDDPIVLFPTGEVLDSALLTETAQKTLFRFKMEPYFPKEGENFKKIPYDLYEIIKEKYHNDMKAFDEKYKSLDASSTMKNKIYSIFIDTETKKKQEQIKILKKYEDTGLEKLYTMNSKGIKTQSGWKMPTMTRKDFILIYEDTNKEIQVDFSPALIDRIMELLKNNIQINNSNLAYDMNFNYL